MALKEQATISYATAQRKIDQGEQDLWVLSASDAPDIAKIETKVGEIASLNGQQRMAFIRTVGEAVSVLSDTQRKAAVSQGETMRPGAIQPAPSAAPMTAPQGSAGSMNQQGGVGSAGPKGGMAPMRDDDSMGKMGGTAPDKKSNNGGMGPM